MPEWTELREREKECKCVCQKKRQKDRDAPSRATFGRRVVGYLETTMARALRAASLKEATDALNKLYPLKYAANSWDNTGLLVDNSMREEDRVFLGPDEEGVFTDRPDVLVTVDLTAEVAIEAIRAGKNMIIAYHPFLFRKFNRIGRSDPQQNSLLALCRNNISVYSPHTAVDAAVGGVNDWLANAVGLGAEGLKTCVPIVPDASGDEGVGMGRVLELNTAITYKELADRMKKALGVSHVQVGIPANMSVGDARISRVAVCAGSGGSLFSEKLVGDCDALVTGELSHHELLAHVQRGRVVVLAGHCNTERAYVSTEMVQKINAAFSSTSAGATVTASTMDRSPFVTL